MSRNVQTPLAAGLLVAALLVAAGPAEAYRMIQNNSTGRVTAGSAVTCNAAGGFAHWTDPDIAWYLNTTGQSVGTAAALRDAVASWTAVPNADHNLTYAGSTSTGWATDGVNTVLFASGNGCTGSCLALTALVLQSGQEIVESDITFNSNKVWSTTGGDYDIEAVMAHEIGHSLGIHHTEVTSTPRPTMYASYFGTGGRSLESDDQAALQCAQSKYPFGGGGGSPPPAPAYLDVWPEYCYGYVSLFWGTSSGATYYEVEESHSSSYSWPTLVYSGSNTSLFTSGTGTRWYRVRACNANGCSGYRNGNQSAPYYNGCY